jgi:nicotinic acid mononucleotide adenylyltransferase
MNSATQINKYGRKMCIAITGGGTGAIYELLRAGGGSNSLIEAIVPYNQIALENFLGYKVEKFCSEHTARKMALRAFQRAFKLTGDPGVVGVGATAVLHKGGDGVEKYSDGSLRKHLLYVAVHTITHTFIYGFEFTDKGMDRLAEEEVSSQAILDVILVSVVNNLDRNPLLDYDSLVTSDWSEMTPSGDMIDLMLGYTKLAPAMVNKPITDLLYPGSFSPAHAGHMRLAKAVADLTDKEVTFEVCIENVAKPPLDWIDICEIFYSVRDQRDIHKVPWANLVFTRLPKFIDKAQHFHQPTFIVGADTAKRIVAPEYCPEGIGAMVSALDNCHAQFIIGEREGTDLTPVKEYLKNATYLTKEQYKDQGESSTKIRNQQ